MGKRGGDALHFGCRNKAMEKYLEEKIVNVEEALKQHKII